MYDEQQSVRRNKHKRGVADEDMTQRLADWLHLLNFTLSTSDKRL